MPISDPPRRVALLVASAGYFFVLLDVTIVNVALPDIGGQLGARRSDLQWVVDAYALVLACEMLSAGDEDVPSLVELHRRPRLTITP